MAELMVRPLWLRVIVLFQELNDLNMGAVSWEVPAIIELADILGNIHLDLDRVFDR